MRHAVKGRKLGRTTSHREALFRNQLQSLMDKERIITTLPKAKELRPLAERVITRGKLGTVHARRWALRWLLRRDLVKKLFDDIAPRFSERPGGYLRIVKLGPRQGDGAEMAVIEMVDFVPPSEKKGEKAPAGKGGAKAAKEKAASKAAKQGAGRKRGKDEEGEEPEVAGEGEEKAAKGATGAKSAKAAKSGKKAAKKGGGGKAAAEGGKGRKEGRAGREPRSGEGRHPTTPRRGGGRKPTGPQKTG
jgi:large subunit ribosomal protein L17